MLLSLSLYLDLGSPTNVSDPVPRAINDIIYVPRIKYKYIFTRRAKAQTEDYRRRPFMNSNQDSISIQFNKGGKTRVSPCPPIVDVAVVVFL